MRWCRCWASGCQGFCPRRVRRTTARAKSSTGSSRIDAGTISGKTVAATGFALTSAPLTVPVTEIIAAARSRPSRSAPESPMKIRASWKLCGRKPKQQPTRAAEIKDTPAEVKTFGGW